MGSQKFYENNKQQIQEKRRKRKSDKRENYVAVPVPVNVFVPVSDEVNVPLNEDDVNDDAMPATDVSEINADIDGSHSADSGVSFNSSDINLNSSVNNAPLHSTICFLKSFLLCFLGF